MASRTGIGEVVGSVSMLVITMALLGSASYLALASINGAATIVDGTARQQSTEAGVLLDTVGSQSNTSGTYVWLFDYGWESAPVGAVFLNAQGVGWSSNCPGNWSESICVVTLPPGARGLVTIVVGGKSVEVSV